jgi:hypothetical protein
VRERERTEERKRITCEGETEPVVNTCWSSALLDPTRTTDLADCFGRPDYNRLF